MRTIQTCPGLGDSVWLLQKLINTKEKFNFQLSNAQPQRGKQLFDMLPQIANACEYVPGLKYKNIIDASAPYQGVKFKDIKVNSFTLQANQHLEAGKRIEDFLPDLEMTYKLPYVTTDSGFDASALTGSSKYIGIYGSAYSTARQWNGWDDGTWFEFIQLMHLQDQDACFVVIGASWDIDLGSKLIKRLQLANIPHYNTIGRSMTYVVELLKVLDYFVGFPSGLSIINESLHKKTFMFYPEDLRLMINAWPEESRIGSYDYIGRVFCSPKETFKLIMDKANVL